MWRLDVRFGPIADIALPALTKRPPTEAASESGRKVRVLASVAMGQEQTLRHSGSPACRKPSDHLAKSSGRRIGNQFLRLDTRSAG